MQQNAGQAPMWWMRGGSRQCPKDSPAAPPSPPQQPVLLPPPVPPQPPKPQLPPEIASLTDRLRHMDGETLLLLALLWLLWQEHADKKLLLALAYIVL